MRKSVVITGTVLAELSPINDGESLSKAKNYRMIAAGAVTNTALSLRFLDTDVKLVSAVSSDNLGKFLLNELTGNGLDTTYIKVIDHLQTSMSLTAVDLKGGKEFIFYRTALLDEIKLADFPNHLTDYIFDFGEGAIRSDEIRNVVFEAAKTAKNNNSYICYAVNLRENSWKKPKEQIMLIQREAIELSDLVILNKEELTYITGCNGTTAVKELHALGPKIVLITSGGDGNTLVSLDGEEISVPIYNVEVKFDVGAGDTFHAGIIAYLSQNEVKTLNDWANCVLFANAAAAYRISTSEQPSSLKSVENILSWMKKQKK